MSGEFADFVYNLILGFFVLPFTLIRSRSFAPTGPRVLSIREEAQMEGLVANVNQSWGDYPAEKIKRAFKNLSLV